MARVLVVDDDADMGRVLVSALASEGWDTATATSADLATSLLDQDDFDAVVTDVRMRGRNGIELCRWIVDRHPDLPVVVITAFGTMETAVEALRAGAYDFLAKPFDLRAFRIVVQRAIHHRELIRTLERLRHPVLRDGGEPSPLLGNSRPILDVIEMVTRVAATEAPVLLTGESGTGKEVVARSLHTSSRRRDGPFVAINCAAVPESLIESELFGHVRGAFTGAVSARRGLFLEANGGTLLLDELAELPLSLQPKLLRVLQERRVRAVGGTSEAAFDARVVVATNRDLEVEVAQGRFRQDLYYRVNVVRIDLPPLRVRGNDVLILAHHFLKHHSASSGRTVTGIQPEAARLLVGYSWPGNVRELENCVQRAVALARFNEVGVDDLPDAVRSATPREATHDHSGVVELLNMDEVERRHVLRVFEATGCNKSLAARVLGFNRKTLYRKLRRYGALAEENEDSDD